MQSLPPRGKQLFRFVFGTGSGADAPLWLSPLPVAGDSPAPNQTRTQINPNSIRLRLDGMPATAGIPAPRRGTPAPQTKQNPMALITINTSRLPVVEKCARGIIIITSGSDNPLVPGNAGQLAAFSANQAALVAKNAEVDLARATLASLLAEREVAEHEWDRGMSFLASFTEAAS